MSNTAQYIQPHEVLLIITDVGEGELETLCYQGPLHKSESADLMAQDGGESQAIRMNRTDLRDVEDVTEELNAVLEPPLSDTNEADMKHIRSCQSPDIYI